MKTIFWLAVAFNLLSAFVILADIWIYRKSSEIDKYFYQMEVWPYPLWLATFVIMLTI